MQIRPVLSALRKHRLATLLITLEIALACAVLCNACFMIAGRLSAMHVDSGVAQPSLGYIKLQGFDSATANDLNARVNSGLRKIPGVQSVSVVNTVPFGQSTANAGVSLEPSFKHNAGVVTFYTAGPGAAKALGLHLVAGRLPRPDEFGTINKYVPDAAQVLVTRALAAHLWPGENPLGKVFWGIGTHFRIIGVLDHLSQPDPAGFGPGQAQWSVFVPAMPGPQLAGSYLIRVHRPADLDRVMTQARAAIRKVAPNVVLDLDQSHTIGYLRHRYFRTDRAMTELLVGVIAALLGITALGIVGLASFWVAQRSKQIGIRRALGATRGDILRYFQTENFLIVTGGIVLGMVLAYGINLLLMRHYELPRLPFVYLPIGALVLWVLGQLAVLAPALRASDVPPVVATRSV
ncbi:FtsX-like permease family protein [Oleiagrimonas sp.]|jgi:putative ABC transport system permease protein|uniref:ABC transporter permease n=1 Tax=Oleiagrimonas sp. TaxID=2010330 RepID=UPI0026023BAC|nr:FtsX-like permease family protein [Oleiagrimonas sp.]MDA3912928.1 FtsX-like permease family protein [Oleiagrimonas sp.]